MKKDDITLTQTLSLGAFLKKAKIEYFNQFFTKKIDGIDCSFFTLVPDEGEKISGLIAKTITDPVNCQAAVSSGKYEVSLLTTPDKNGQPRTTWLIHRKPDPGKAGSDDAIDFG